MYEHISGRLGARLLEDSGEWMFPQQCGRSDGDKTEGARRQTPGATTSVAVLGG